MLTRTLVTGVSAPEPPTLFCSKIWITPSTQLLRTSTCALETRQFTPPNHQKNQINPSTCPPPDRRKKRKESHFRSLLIFIFILFFWPFHVLACLSEDWGLSWAIWLANLNDINSNAKFVFNVYFFKSVK